jgi:hypothetical protein
MTNEQIEIELKHLATKADLADLKAEIYKSFAELIKTLWLSQLTALGVILVAVGLMIHFKI